MDLLPLAADTTFRRASSRRSCSDTSSFSRSRRAMASSVPHRCAYALGRAATAHAASSKAVRLRPRPSVRVIIEFSTLFPRISGSRDSLFLWHLGAEVVDLGVTAMPISAGSRYHDELIATAVRSPAFTSARIVMPRRLPRLHCSARDDSESVDLWKLCLCGGSKEVQSFRSMR